MQWEDSAKARFFYRSREHQYAQFLHVLDHAGSLEGLSVLDVGCGYGDILGMLPPCNYLGIDVDEGAVEQARRLWPGHCFKVTGTPTSCDVILAIGTLHVCEDPRAALQSWIRAARLRVVVATSTREHLTAPMQAAEESWWKGIPHERFPSEDDFYVAVITPVMV